MLAAVLVTVAACGGEGQNDPPTEIEDAVYTTFYPLAWMAERLAGDDIAVRCPIPADEDPIFWQPSRDAVAAFQNARLIAINGAEFEKWVATASLPVSRVVETAAALQEPLITFKGDKHSHGGVDHVHEGVDGHTWVDPQNAKVQAMKLAKAMAKTWPDHSPAIMQRVGDLQNALDRLHVRLLAMSSRVREITLLTNHPAYNYLARRYQWKLKNFDLDPEEPIPNATLAKLAVGVEKAGVVRIMLWESAPNAATARLLEDRFRVKSVVFSPLEARSEDDVARGADYIKLMEENVSRLGAALK